jgi:hypothetical protein
VESQALRETGCTPHPGSARKRADPDLSPQAGRGNVVVGSFSAAFRAASCLPNIPEIPGRQLAARRANSARGGDIAAAEAFGPRDPVDRGLGVFAGPAEIGADGGDAEHAASGACSFFLLRPSGLPDCPFRKRVWNGGRPGHTF